MYEICIEDSFSAAHYLDKYPDVCSKLHGHTFKVQVIFRVMQQDEIGISLDLRKAKEKLRKILSYLDHKFLNELDIFKDKNPTSENIALYIYNTFKKEEKSIIRVNIWEDEVGYVSYIGE